MLFTFVNTQFHVFDRVGYNSASTEKEYLLYFFFQNWFCEGKNAEASKSTDYWFRFLSTEKVLTNKDLEKMVDTSDEWIVSRTGMKERRIAGPDEFSSDMGLKAAETALKQSGLAARGDRSGGRRHDDARLPFPLDLCFDPGEDRRTQRRGRRYPIRLHRIPLRTFHGQSIYRVRGVSPCISRRFQKKCPPLSITPTGTRACSLATALPPQSSAARKSAFPSIQYAWGRTVRWLAFLSFLQGHAQSRHAFNHRQSPAFFEDGEEKRCSSMLCGGWVRPRKSV